MDQSAGKLRRGGAGAPLEEMDEVRYLLLKDALARLPFQELADSTTRRANAAIISHLILNVAAGAVGALLTLLVTVSGPESSLWQQMGPLDAYPYVVGLVATLLAAVVAGAVSAIQLRRADDRAWDTVIARGRAVLDKVGDGGSSA